jgi:hypothetical protein
MGRTSAQSMLLYLRQVLSSKTIKLLSSVVNTLNLLGTLPRDEIRIGQCVASGSPALSVPNEKRLRESALVVQFKAQEVLRLVGGP